MSSDGKKKEASDEEVKKKRIMMEAKCKDFVEAYKIRHREEFMRNTRKNKREERVLPIKEKKPKLHSSQPKLPSSLNDDNNNKLPSPPKPKLPSTPPIVTSEYNNNIQNQFPSHPITNELVSSLNGNNISPSPPIITNGLVSSISPSPSITNGVLYNNNNQQTNGVASSSDQAETITKFLNLLSIERIPPVSELIKSGVIPSLVGLLKEDDFSNHQMEEDFPQPHFKVASALANIASGTSEHKKALIGKETLPLLVKLLSSPSDDVCEQAIWALGNVAGDSPTFRDLVIGQGALCPLLSYLDRPSVHSNLSLLRNATWTLANLCRGTSITHLEMVKQVLPALKWLIRSEDEEVCSDACWALSYVSYGTDDHVEAVIAAGVCKHLISLLLNPLPSILIPVLRIVGKLASGDYRHVQRIIIDIGAIPYLQSLLANDYEISIKKEACNTISNITRGSTHQIQCMIDAGVITSLIKLLQDPQSSIKIEAARAISYAILSSSDEQIKYMLEQRLIKLLCELRLCRSRTVVNLIGEALENIGKRVGKSTTNSRQMMSLSAIPSKTTDVDSDQINTAVHTYKVHRSEKIVSEIRLKKREQNLPNTHQVWPGISLPMIVEKKLGYRSPIYKSSKDTNIQPELLSSMINEVSLKDDMQPEAITEMCKLISIECLLPVEEVRKSRVVPLLIEFFNGVDFSKHQMEELQIKAASALASIASGTPEHKDVLVAYGALPILVKLLSSPSDDVCEQALWALGCVTGDFSMCCELDLDLEALRLLLNLLDRPRSVPLKLSLLRNATWAVANICRAIPEPPLEMRRQVLGALQWLVESDDEEVLTDACWALSYLSLGTREHIQVVIEANICERLLSLLFHPSPSVIIPALRTVGNIAAGDDSHIKHIIDLGAVPCLLSFLTNCFEVNITKEACMAISNINEGNQRKIQYVIDAELIVPLLKLFKDHNYSIKKEAARAISNAVLNGGHKQLEYLVGKRCVESLYDLLLIHSRTVGNMIVEAIEKIEKRLPTTSAVE